MGPSLDRRLDKFFRTELLPISQQYAREGRQVLAGSPDPQSSSYFLRRTKTTMTRADFESGSCACPADLADVLAEMWRQQGFGELSALAPQMAKLAERLKQSQHETEEVSPFVYAMY
jgi:hypothetical protein